MAERRRDAPANIERGSEPELESVVQVVEPDGGPQGAQLGHTSGHSVGGGAHLGGVQLSGQQEGGAVGSELSPEGGEEVHLDDDAIFKPLPLEDCAAFSDS